MLWVVVHICCYESIFIIERKFKTQNLMFYLKLLIYDSLSQFESCKKIDPRCSHKQQNQIVEYQYVDQIFGYYASVSSQIFVFMVKVRSNKIKDGYSRQCVIYVMRSHNLISLHVYKNMSSKDSDTQVIISYRRIEKKYKTNQPFAL